MKGKGELPILKPNVRGKLDESFGWGVKTASPAALGESKLNRKILVVNPKPLAKKVRAC